ncbi:MAG: trigger factor [Chloroflexi bacterium]|nr:trigger factor [Chloroflexota bacterium]
MSLTIQSQEDEQRQLLLTVEVSEDRVKKAMRQAARALAGEVNVPGFRKGKAPYHVIVRRVGEVQLRAEAVEDMVQSVFEEALREIDVIPYAQASLDKMEMEPVVFQFTVPLEPQLTLDESYRDLRKDVEAVEISDEAIAEALELVRLRHQVIESVERPVAQGDVVSVSGKGVLLPATAPEQESSEEETEAAADSLEAEEVVLFDEDETGAADGPGDCLPRYSVCREFHWSFCW